MPYVVIALAVAAVTLAYMQEFRRRRARTITEGVTVSTLASPHRD